MNSQGKTAIITGASRGIGRAIALELATQGYNLGLVATQKANLEEVAQSCEKKGSKVKTFGVNVADSKSVQDCVDEILTAFGSITVLVNNAGITRDNLLLRMSDEDWQSVLDVNLKGAFHFLRAVTRPMMKAKFGRIINISSVSGLVGNPGQVNYSASKAGLVGMTKAAALELASRGITVNAIAPGFIQTDMTKDLEAQVEKIVERIPMGRFGNPQDIAACVGYLASPQASYVTGQVLVVDGGLSL